MQAELGIGVLGHREALLAGIQSLPKASPTTTVHGSPVQAARPGSPQSPILQAKLHRSKLQRDLEKAELHAASLNRFVLHIV